MTGTRFQGSWKGLTNEDKITGAWCSMRTHFTNQNRLRDWPLRLHPSTFQNFDPFLNLFSLFLFLYWLMIRVVTTQISSQSPRYRWGYVIALIRDVCHLSSPLFSLEGEETVVRASFNQRRLISISEQPSISPLACFSFFHSIVVDRCLSFFLPFFLPFFRFRFFARVHDRLSRPFGTAHNYSSGTLPNSRSLITVFERHARSVNGCRVIDALSSFIESSTVYRCCNSIDSTVTTLFTDGSILERWFKVVVLSREREILDVCLRLEFSHCLTK